MTSRATPDEVLAFWFNEPISSHWFSSTPEIDALIRDKFESLWATASNNGLDEWREMVTGSLALVIILDQFPLNMYRGEAISFSTEALAVDVSLAAIKKGFDQQLDSQQKAFLYMPLMHSESMQHQALSVELYEKAGLESNARFARHHRDIIRRFGRFPHRNAILGRESSPDELEYLESKEAFKG